MTPPYLLVGMVAIFLAVAWSGHTDRSRKDAALIVATFAALGWKHEDAAKRMGLTLPQLSRQLSGREPLNKWRVEELGEEFDIAYLRVKAKAVGGLFVEPELVGYLRASAQLGDIKAKAGRTRTVELPLQKVEAS